MATRWPEWHVAEVFVPRRAARTGASAWFALRQELTDAAWGGSDPRPGEAKLGVVGRGTAGLGAGAPPASAGHRAATVAGAVDVAGRVPAGVACQSRTRRADRRRMRSARWSRLPKASPALPSTLFGGNDTRAGDERGHRAACRAAAAAGRRGRAAADAGATGRCRFPSMRGACMGGRAAAALATGRTMARCPGASTRRCCANACAASQRGKALGAVRAGASCGPPGAPRAAEPAERHAPLQPCERRLRRRPLQCPPVQPSPAAVSTFPTSSSPLPDVAHDAAALARPLDWVGMERIALPVRIADADGRCVQVAASVDVAVDLRDADARGIHMSRLYLQLQEAFATRNHHARRAAPRAAGLHRIAAGPVDQRAAGAALRPPAAARGAGQRASRLEALSGGDRGRRCATATCGSRCAVRSNIPAPVRHRRRLSRQLNAERFAEDFAGARPLSTEVVRDWLASERGLAATPHAQRSRADVRVELRPAFDELPVAALDRPHRSRARHAGADRGQARGRAGLRPPQCRQPDVLRGRRASRAPRRCRPTRASSASTSASRTSRACIRTMRWRGSPATTRPDANCSTVQWRPKRTAPRDSRMRRRVGAPPRATMVGCGRITCRVRAPAADRPAHRTAPRDSRMRRRVGAPPRATVVGCGRIHLPRSSTSSGSTRTSNRAAWTGGCDEGLARRCARQWSAAGGFTFRVPAPAADRPARRTSSSPNAGAARSRARSSRPRRSPGPVRPGRQPSHPSATGAGSCC